jgi:hypothetical protein
MDSNFVIMNLPSYVNFYNVQDVIKNPIPKAEGTLEFGNTLFGTFTNVDYRESSSKMVCFYGGKASEFLKTDNNSSSRYKDDSFDMRRASDNPLSENQQNKVDWALSNKVVAFNVEFGPQNQSIFNGFTVGQDSRLETAETYKMLFDTRNQGSGRGTSSQSSGLYDLYKTRSYKCTVNMLGNAMIQPTMYFNLRHVPMFSGPYMITSVNHTISPGKFDTSFEGVRQPIASLPLPTDYLATLKQSLITKSEQLIKQQASSGKLSSGNIINNSSYVISKATKGVEIAEVIDCNESLYKRYEKYYQLDSVDKVITTYNFKEIKTIIISTVSITALSTRDKKILEQIIFCSFYLTSGNKTGFSAVNNNFASIDLTTDWAETSNFFNKNSYVCLKNNVNIVKPFALFDSLKNSISFLINRWSIRLNQLSLNEKLQLKSEEALKFWVINIESDSNVGQENYNNINIEEKKIMEQRISQGINIFSVTKT